MKETFEQGDIVKMGLNTVILVCSDVNETEFSGTVIESRGTYNRGYHSETWKKYRATDYTETITITIN